MEANSTELRISQFRICQALTTYSFLNCSLDALTKSLKASNHDFPIFMDYFKRKGFSDEICQQLRRKGVFPNKHVKSEKDLGQTSLPGIKTFIPP